jgi:hypothetical protein
VRERDRERDRERERQTDRYKVRKKHEMGEKTKASASKTF